MFLFIYTYYILQINPASAVENISNANLIGSFFILFLFSIITLSIVIKKLGVKFIDRLNDERVAKDKEADEYKERLITYMVNEGKKNAEIIKSYTDSNDNLTIALNSIKIVTEKLLTKL